MRLIDLLISKIIGRAPSLQSEEASKGYLLFWSNQFNHIESVTEMRNRDRKVMGRERLIYNRLGDFVEVFKGGKFNNYLAAFFGSMNQYRRFKSFAQVFFKS